MKKVLFWFFWICLLGIACTSLRDAVDDLTEAHGLGQRIVNCSGLTNGITGIVAAFAILLRKKWDIYFLVPWCATAVISASVAAIAYGGAPVWAALVGGIAAGALCVLICYGLKKSEYRILSK